jgi:high-affinity iron transporter
MTDALWDTSAILSDQSLVGPFLAGLVGYRAQPTGLEVAAYVLYVVVAGALIFGVGRTADPEAADRSVVRA